jgi:hypothetical protein
LILKMKENIGTQKTKFEEILRNHITLRDWATKGWTSKD